MRSTIRNIILFITAQLKTTFCHLINMYCSYRQVGTDIIFFCCPLMHTCDHFCHFIDLSLILCITSSVVQSSSLPSSSLAIFFINSQSKWRFSFRITYFVFSEFCRATYFSYPPQHFLFLLIELLIFFGRSTSETLQRFVNLIQSLRSKAFVNIFASSPV